MKPNKTLIESVEYVEVDNRYFPVKETLINSVDDFGSKHLYLYALATDMETQEEFKIKIEFEGSVKCHFALVDNEEWERRFE